MIVFVMVVVAGDCGGQDPIANGDDVSIGLDGLHRIGHWTGIQLDSSIQDASPSLGTDAGSDASQIAIQTRDGDATRVQYINHVERVSASNGSSWIYAKPGDQSAPLEIQRGERSIWKGRFPSDDNLLNRPATVSESKAWVAILGNPMGIDKLGINVVQKQPTAAVSHLDEGRKLPDRSIGYDGLDLMIIGGQSSTWIGDLSNRQRAAILDWIRDGGHALLMLGESADELFAAAPWIRSLLPFEAGQPTAINPSGLEVFTASQTPLQTYLGIRIPADDGEILVRGRTLQRLSTALAARYTVGFGTVTVIAADLDGPQFENWPQRIDLIHSLTDRILLREKDTRIQQVSGTYNDLAGQLRSQMDRFPSTRRTNFSVLSILMIGMITLIGPVEYWFINRVLRRPMWGWVTFPATAIALSIFLVYQSGWSQAATLESNRIEVLDIDLSRDRLHGDDHQSIGSRSRLTLLESVYTQDARRIDWRIKPAAWLDGTYGERSESLLAPLGSPGPAFGGIRLSVEDERLPIYQVMIPAQTRSPGDPSNLVSTEDGKIDGIPMASRSSRSLMGRFEWNQRPPAADDGDANHEDRIVLRRLAGSQFLEGPLTNPLPVDLLDGRLIYQNLAYLLPTRFAAGGTIARVQTLRQKNFRWLLSRQTATESSSRTESWRPQDERRERVIEMMMYHDAAGGMDYTGLQHRPLGELDLSGVLDRDHCLLVGRIEQPMCDVTTGSSPNSDEVDLNVDRIGLVRVLMSTSNMND